MVQHMLLTLLAPPPLLAGVPGWRLAPLTRNRATNAVGSAPTRSLVAYAVASVTLIAWYMPALYEAALFSDALHATEHAAFFATALLAWWPVLGSLPQWPRISPPLQCLYFFAQTIPGAIVGAFLVFSPPGLYRPYDLAPRVFGIDLANDEQIAGLLMWVGEGVIYLLLITVVFLRWAGAEERAGRRSLRHRTGLTAWAMLPVAAAAAPRHLPVPTWPNPRMPRMSDHRPPQRRRAASSAEPEFDSGAAVWAFLWILFGFKLATVGLIFWQLSTFETGIILGATTWYWFPVMGAMAAAPIAFHLRLRRARAKRAELLRSEWMLPGEATVGRRDRVRR